MISKIVNETKNFMVGVGVILLCISILVLMAVVVHFCPIYGLIAIALLFIWGVGRFMREPWK
jgi:hypothetical protein